MPNIFIPSLNAQAYGISCCENNLSTQYKNPVFKLKIILF